MVHSRLALKKHIKLNNNKTELQIITSTQKQLFQK